HNISNYLIDRFLIEEEKFYILLCSSKEALTSINIFKKYNKEQNKIAAAVISPEFTELERIKEHYEMSVNVIRLLYKLHISGVRKAEEWLPFSLLMHCRNTSEYNFIKTTVLDKLQEYDRRYQSSLLDTLSAALRENSLEDAAERQHIHINTLRYRLGKIKEITQKNYFKMTDRYFLLLCIMIQRMEHEQL
ncbi:MAG: helix-turn-helix domain-containing protein, partial [Phascolarctobacterium sp.]|nr:helix-turn-helix domain-containing protein [Phascolarctobacterium sp.]